MPRRRRVAPSINEPAKKSPHGRGARLEWADENGRSADARVVTMRTPSHGRNGRRAANGQASANVVRRALMTDDARVNALLPPWARSADAFDRACTRCAKCVDACPTHVLKIVEGVVRVDFADAECTFCGACVDACPEPAFDVAARAASARPWTAVARIGPTCLAKLGIACESCGDACEAHAIRFRVHAGLVPDPRVDSTHCTGCGACVRVCPATAIDVRKASG